MRHFHKGIAVRAKRTIRYCMGQIPSDKISRGEILIVDEVDNKKQTLTFVGHADRYGPWHMNDFRIRRSKIKGDKFWEIYKPIKNHFVEGSAYDDCMFETYGQEVAFVRKQNFKKIWTIVDAEGELVIIAGWHFVNRLGYLITENEWLVGDEEVQDI